jgi:hypothetical protein
MLKITEVGKTRSIMLDDADIYEIMKPTTSTYVTVTTNGGAQRYTIQQSIATLQTQYPPNQLVKVTQVSDNTVFLLYAHRVKTWVENVDGTTQVNFYTGRSHLTVIEDFATIQANYSIASDNFISSIAYQDADPTPGPTTPNYPNLLSTYNNGGTRLTNLTGLFAALGAPFVLANTLFVSTNGNNGTAIIGRQDKTWADPWAAIAAATSGQAVVIFPGAYTSASGFLIKTGVKAFAYPGVTITYTSTLAGSDSPFATNNSTRTNGVFKGYADINFAKTSGNFQVGGYIDGVLDIELGNLIVDNANIFFPESASLKFKLHNSNQTGSGANEFLRLESTATSGVVKQYQIDILNGQFANCDYGVVTANNVDVNAQINIKNLRYTNLTTDLTSQDNTDCGASNINVNIKNVFQTGTSQGGVVVDMKNFGNATTPTNNCKQTVRVKNIMAKLSAMRIGDCYDGLTEIELSGVLQMTTASITSPITNTNTGKCLIKTDLVFNWTVPAPTPATFAQWTIDVNYPIDADAALDFPAQGSALGSGDWGTGTGNAVTDAADIANAINSTFPAVYSASSIGTQVIVNDLVAGVTANSIVDISTPLGQFTVTVIDPGTNLITFAVSEFNGENSLYNNHFSGDIKVLGKLPGDPAIWEVTGNTQNHLRLKDLNMVTGADYCVGDVPVGATTLDLADTNTFSNKPINPAALVVEVLENITASNYVQ